MKKSLLVVLAVLSMAQWTNAQFAEGAMSDTTTRFTRIYIVRHADRAGSEDSLTAAGVVRAAELVKVLEKVDIGKVYSTNTKRTKNTAQPVASARGLSIETYADNTDLLKKIDKSKTSLVVGHSNTLGDLIRKCGCNPPLALNSLPESEYDNLFLVFISTKMVNGKAVASCDFQQLKYGAH